MSTDFGDFPEMDVGDVDSSKIGSHVNVDKAGKYHFAITDVRYQGDPVTKNGNQRRPDFLVTCEVLETVPGQSGKGAIYFHSLPVAGRGGAAPEGWVKESFSNFLCGIGVLVIKDGVVTDPTTGTTRIEMRTLAERIMAVQQFIGEIKVNKSDDPQYADRYELSFGRGAFLVDDPAVAGVPKNEAALKVIGKASAAAPAAGSNGKGGKGTGTGTGKKAETPPAAPQQQESGLDTSDL